MPVFLVNQSSLYSVNYQINHPKLVNHNSEEPAKRWAVKNGDFWSSYFLPPIFLPEMHLSDGCETDVVVRDVGPMDGLE